MEPIKATPRKRNQFEATKVASAIALIALIAFGTVMFLVSGDAKSVLATVMKP